IVARRLDRLADWNAAISSGWRPAFEHADPVTNPARKAWQLLPPCLQIARRLLEPLREIPYRQHPCLGDVWHDHVLLLGTQISGLIDYGAARFDTPAADLARLLGSFAPTDDELFSHGLKTYRSMAMVTDEEVGLVHILDYTGAALSAATWLLWLYRDARVFDNRPAVAQRLAMLVDRLERTHRVTLPMLG